MNVLELPYGTEEDESRLRATAMIGVRQLWYKKDRMGMWHRLRGPAIIHVSGHESWYRYGMRYTPTAHELMMWELRKKNECY